MTVPLVTSRDSTGLGGRTRHFALDFRPAYSPELNSPIERVWELARRRPAHALCRKSQRRHQRSRGRIRNLHNPQRGLTTTMRNYLRRNVFNTG